MSSYLLGHVFPLHKVHFEVLFWATLTKWDVNSSDYNPYGVGDCLSNLPGEGSTFFFFQLLLQQLCTKKKRNLSFLERLLPKVKMGFEENSPAL